ncbi:MULTISPECIES: hypothetical protein [Mycobacterium]|uniref:Nitroreductase n=1 Tax=Mycobacterium kiyosense TaxID=2871094 RepID=A0AA37PY71_9MYCO|nr:MULTISPECIES: hypothetical protein [Mycobacterium]BDE17154.1 hypothetical protein MKCMC460_60140 [Mycobacterium sp. 20KCMC460]GLB86636.1 hypothetical protein SRL2020028_58920 [Mycobacterium kiyosense]GLB92456.1 hypothetical protein SRL2020130_52730 [Mycobacterium kiyosense]GLC04682.1 hypothetical protein SRL2020400_52730 [Mycobacterium kiyosense]GLC11231.1 hypothetical protein SRL2020411_58770 [Mycobacterium kiyosense]
MRAGQNPRIPGRPLSDAEQWWQYSRKCAAALQAGLPPTPVSVFGPVLRAGELALLNVDVGYSRYSGSKASCSPLPLIVAGRPGVMVGALAVQGLINHRRKSAAQRQAAPQWRWHQTTAAIVTTERLLCATEPHGLVSLWFGDCTEFHPDLQQWTLTLGFGSTVPVRFSGVATPALSLLSAYGTFGDAWADDPRLAALLA